MKYRNAQKTVEIRDPEEPSRSVECMLLEQRIAELESQVMRLRREMYDGARLLNHIVAREAHLEKLFCGDVADTFPRLDLVADPDVPF